ncbi:hypothetical protein O0L34_g11726 [Tuta absoluta]|nr:hypothetical protein O0L34_g11726 [Tuta absoluta]
MQRQRRENEACLWYMEELSSRVVAESGRACDRFHLGKLILRGLKDAPQHTLQIDAETGQSETSGSVLERSVKCAVALKNSGIQQGDVIVLLAPNNLDVAVVYYATLYIGAIFSSFDRNTKDDELAKILDCDKPKLIICQTSKLSEIRDALTKINLKPDIVTFEESGDPINTHCCFAEFMKRSGSNIVIDEFKATDFDPETTIAALIVTSGTTGIPKKAMLTHKNFVLHGSHPWTRFSKFPSPTRMVLLAAPIQWISIIIHFNMSPILRYTRLQTSGVTNTQHIQHMINTYKPTVVAMTPTAIGNLLKLGDQVDFSSFEFIVCGGAPVTKDLIEEVRKAVPQAEVFQTYGSSEANSYIAFEMGTSPLPIESCGRPARYLQYRLINMDTQEDITESNESGELWIKGPGIAKGYYNNPEATKETLTEDGWFKTGDMFYRDDEWNFYYVERINSLIRYGQYLVSPAELEATIRSHPDVSDVAVSEILDSSAFRNSLPVACIVRRPGSSVTAQMIKDLVKNKLEDWKQLRGGVVFLEELPLTPTIKIDRKKLKQIVLEQNRE